jgi:O-acetyl-ADP-ribose deacetylase (regulator of RNase III)
VIHTVGPVFSPSQDRSSLLAGCHADSLRVANRLGAGSIAFPAISTGVYGYPLNLAAPVAVRAVRDTAVAAGPEGWSVRDVRFVLFDDAAYRAFRDALDALEAGAPP